MTDLELYKNYIDDFSQSVHGGPIILWKDKEGNYYVEDPEGKQLWGIYIDTSNEVDYHNEGCASELWREHFGSKA